jgi:endothelin-converting enzyme
MFDEYGRLRDWWSNTTSAEFNNRARCFVDQYSAFTITDSMGRSYSMDAEYGLGEILADNGGVGESVASWESTLNVSIVNRFIPVSNLTRIQVEYNHFVRSTFLLIFFFKLFYMAYGQMWCRNVNPDYAVSMVGDLCMYQNCGLTIVNR